MRRLKAIAALGVFAVAMAVTGAAGSATTVNLVQNPGAEDGAGGWSAGNPLGMNCSGSDGTAPLFRESYSNTSDVPARPGSSAEFGNRLWSGKNGTYETNSCGYQKIDLRPHHALTHFTLSAWLGSDANDGEDDDASARACFYDEGGHKLGCSKEIIVENGGAGTLNGRLLFRSTDNVLPHGFAWAIVEVALDEDGSDGENEAAADNISLTLWGP
jgi:hypothetical protein